MQDINNQIYSRRNESAEDAVEDVHHITERKLKCPEEGCDWKAKLDSEDDRSNTQKMTVLEMIKSHMMWKHATNTFKVTETVVDKWLILD